MLRETSQVVSPKKKIKGVNVPHLKGTTDSQTLVMGIPEMIVMPMLQHIGTPCIPLVKKGDHVKVGQVVGDIKDKISAPIHSSVSGVVTDYSVVVMPDGYKSDALIIKPDGEQTLAETIRVPVINSAEEFIEEVRNSGLVGLGGAGFPTHIKLRSALNKADVLIINAAECEPYITSDYSELMENTDDIMFGIQKVSEYLNIKNIIIAIEDNKPEAVEHLYDIISKTGASHIAIKVLKSSYPQGAEKVLIYNVTGRKMATGQIPADVGVLVMNISSISFLGRYLKTGMPLITRRITVDGDPIDNPANVIAPVGSRVSDIIDFCGGYKKSPGKIIIGGPMMGVSIYDDTMPIIKQNNAIIAMDEESVLQFDEKACIRCGRCVRNCPMSLMPVEIMRYYKKDMIDIVNEYGVVNCIECGCCSYVCPAGIPVTQYMKLAKKVANKQRNTSDAGKESR